MVSHNLSLITASLLIGLFIVLSMGFVSAEVEHLGTVKQNNCISIIKSSSNSSNCSVLSIQYPNKSADYIPRVMTQQGMIYNYTFCSTSQLDQYIINGYCDGVGTWTYDFKVTTTGQDYWFLLPLFLLIGSFLILGFSVMVKNEYFGLISGMLFIVAGIYMMVYGLGLFADMYTRTMAYISLGVGLIVCFVAIVEMFYTDLGIIGGGESE